MCYYGGRKNKTGFLLIQHLFSQNLPKWGKSYLDSLKKKIIDPKNGMEVLCCLKRVEGADVKKAETVLLFL